MSLSLNIIDRYILKEITITWLAVLLVLVIVVTSVEMVHFLKWFLEGELTTETVLPLFINSQMKFIVLLIPISLFLGVLLAFSRMYMDSEMTAMMAGGIGPRQWLRPLFMVAIPVSLLVLVMMLYMRPWVAKQRADINAQIRNVSIISTLAPGRFNTARQGNAVVFMESISEDGTVMENVFQRFVNDDEVHVDLALTARNIKHDNGRNYTLLKDGYHYIGTPGQAEYQIIKYEEYGMLIPEPEDRTYPLRVKALSTSQLWHSDNPEHKAELDWRISIAIATLLIVFMALPMSQTTPRGGRYSKLALAILLYLVYSNLLGIGKTWIAKDVVPWWLGTSWVHLMAVIVLIILFKRAGFIVSKSKPASNVTG